MLEIGLAVGFLDQDLIALGNQHYSAEISRSNVGHNPLICTMLDSYNVKGGLGGSRAEPHTKQTEDTSERVQ